jgi:hypothetical protein
VRRLQARSIQIVVISPMAKAREAAHVTFGSTISSGDTLAQSVSKADVILICNPDPSVTALPSYVSPERYIVDPWGSVQDAHPGLTRPGRLPLHGRLARSSQQTSKSTAVS